MTPSYVPSNRSHTQDIYTDMKHGVDTPQVEKLEPVCLAVLADDFNNLSFIKIDYLKFADKYVSLCH